MDDILKINNKYELEFVSIRSLSFVALNRSALLSTQSRPSFKLW